MVEFIDSGPRLTEGDIAAAEERFGRSIPPAYKTFLLAHNGGEPDVADFRIRRVPKGLSERAVVRSFLGIGQGTRTLEIEYALDMFNDRIPAHFFPVASDPGGNLIGIITDGEEVGAVYFWDHEFEGEEGQPTSANLYPIADSFEEFLTLLR